MLERLTLLETSGALFPSQTAEDLMHMNTAGRPDEHYTGAIKDQKRRRRHGRPLSATASPYISPSILSSAISTDAFPPTPNINPSCSFTLSALPDSIPPLLNMSLPTVSSTHSIVLTPTHITSVKTTPAQLYALAFVSDTSTELSTSKTHLGLGLYRECGTHLDGLGILPRRSDGAAHEEADIPSRIFLEEIYQSFSSPGSFSARSFGSSRDLSTTDELDDVFIEGGSLGSFTRNAMSGNGSSPMRTGRPSKRPRVCSVESQMRAFKWDYVRPTIASRAKSVKAGERDGEGTAKPLWRF